MPLEKRSRWQTPDVELVIEEQCLAIDTKEQNWSLQKNKREDAGEVTPLFAGKFLTPIVLINASYWRFDSNKEKERTALIITVRKVCDFSVFVFAFNFSL